MLCSYRSPNESVQRTVDEITSFGERNATLQELHHPETLKGAFTQVYNRTTKQTRDRVFPRLVRTVAIIQVAQDTAPDLSIIMRA